MSRRRCYRRKNGKRHASWALVKICRTVHGPRQRVAAYLEEMDQSWRAGVKRCAEASRAIQSDLFDGSAPGPVDTPLAARITSNDAAMKASAVMHAFGRIGPADDVAPGIASLPGPEYSWVTGHIPGIGGGLGTLRSR